MCAAWAERAFTVWIVFYLCGAWRKITIALGPAGHHRDPSAGEKVEAKLTHLYFRIGGKWPESVAPRYSPVMVNAYCPFRW